MRENVEDFLAIIDLQSNNKKSALLHRNNSTFNSVFSIIEENISHSIVLVIFFYVSSYTCSVKKMSKHVLFLFTCIIFFSFRL